MRQWTFKCFCEEVLQERWMFSPLRIQLTEHPNHLHCSRAHLLVVIREQQAGLDTPRHTYV